MHTFKLVEDWNGIMHNEDTKSANEKCDRKKQKKSNFKQQCKVQRSTRQKRQIERKIKTF